MENFDDHHLLWSYSPLSSFSWTKDSSCRSYTNDQQEIIAKFKGVLASNLNCYYNNTLRKMQSVLPLPYFGSMMTLQYFKLASTTLRKHPKRMVSLSTY